MPARSRDRPSRIAAVCFALIAFVVIQAPSATAATFPFMERPVPASFCPSSWMEGTACYTWQDGDREVVASAQVNKVAYAVQPGMIAFSPQNASGCTTVYTPETYPQDWAPVAHSCTRITGTLEAVTHGRYHQFNQNEPYAWLEFSRFTLADGRSTLVTISSSGEHPWKNRPDCSMFQYKGVYRTTGAFTAVSAEHMAACDSYLPAAPTPTPPPAVGPAPTTTPPTPTTLGEDRGSIVSPSPAQGAKLTAGSTVQIAARFPSSEEHPLHVVTLTTPNGKHLDLGQPTQTGRTITFPPVTVSTVGTWSYRVMLSSGVDETREFTVTANASGPHKVTCKALPFYAVTVSAAGATCVMGRATVRAFRNNWRRCVRAGRCTVDQQACRVSYTQTDRFNVRCTGARGRVTTFYGYTA